MMDSSAVVLAIVSSLLFLAAALVFWRVQGRQGERHLQLFLPLVAIVLSLLVGLLTPSLRGLVEGFLPDLARGGAGSATPALRCLQSALGNALFLVLLAAADGLYLALARRFRQPMEDLFRDQLSVCYVRDRVSGGWSLRDDCRGGARIAFGAFVATVVVSLALFVLASFGVGEAVVSGFCPCFLVGIAGEVAHYLYVPRGKALRAQAVVARAGASSASLAAALRVVFGDRLILESQRERASHPEGSIGPQGESNAVIRDLLTSLDRREHLAGEYYQAVAARADLGGLGLRNDWIEDSVALLKGTSVLFANPFYRDLAPYVFLPANAQLMRGRKTLLVYGSQDSAARLEEFAEEGLAFVTNVPGTWSIGTLERDGSASPDVAIMAYSDLCDAGLLHANETFFANTSFVMLVDASSLLATFQIGLAQLSSLLAVGAEVTYCAFDHNCDGLVDSLSHALRTHLTEVGATEYGQAESHGMYWDVDGDGVRREVLPDVSRYLGMGAELGLVALRHHVDTVTWAGRSAVPLADVRWILGQYYGEATEYAGLPVEQRQIDEHFEFDWDLWSIRQARRRFVVAEDELDNLFETYRQFATRGVDDVFVNVLSPRYLLRDYMAANPGVFSADPKAIPSIAPDFAKSPRNAAFGLAMAMLQTDWQISEDVVREQLVYSGLEVEDTYDALSRLFVEYLDPDGEYAETPESHIQVTENFEYDPAVKDMVYKRTFSLSGEAQYARSFELLRSVPVLSETPEGVEELLGSRLYGLLWQVILPGQHITIDGRYYEILRISGRNGVLLRRASDHFLGRRHYRQLRRYELGLGEESSHRKIGDVVASCVSARIDVETAGYLDMVDQADVRHARRVEVEGVPVRTYRNKGLLRLELTGASADATASVAVVLSELFVTLFPKDHQYLSVLTAAAEGLPEGILDTLSSPVAGEVLVEADDEGATDEDEASDGAHALAQPRNVIYVVEDAIVDMGLLSAVDRNLQRILETCWEYLDWALHKDDRKLPDLPIPAELLPDEDDEDADGSDSEKPEGSEGDVPADGQPQLQGSGDPSEGQGEPEATPEPTEEGKPSEPSGTQVPDKPGTNSLDGFDGFGGDNDKGGL